MLEFLVFDTEFLVFNKTFIIVTHVLELGNVTRCETLQLRAQKAQGGTNQIHQTLGKRERERVCVCVRGSFAQVFEEALRRTLMKFRASMCLAVLIRFRVG